MGYLAGRLPDELLFLSMLVQLVPGANEGPGIGLSSGGRPDDRRSSSSFSANGQDDTLNNYVIDGIDGNELPICRFGQLNQRQHNIKGGVSFIRRQARNVQSASAAGPYTFGLSTVLMKDLGLKTFRLSVSWSRISRPAKATQPARRGFLQPYVRLVAQGWQTAVLYYHWDLRQALQHKGG